MLSPGTDCRVGSNICMHFCSRHIKNSVAQCDVMSLVDTPTRYVNAMHNCHWIELEFKDEKSGPGIGFVEKSA